VDQPVGGAAHGDLRSGQGGRQGRREPVRRREAFDSGELEQDDSFSHTFTRPGACTYFCIEHERMGMVATVVVER
jgi:plastocyanin